MARYRVSRPLDLERGQRETPPAELVDVVEFLPEEIRREWGVPLFAGDRVWVGWGHWAKGRGSRAYCDCERRYPWAWGRTKMAMDTVGCERGEVELRKMGMSRVDPIREEEEEVVYVVGVCGRCGRIHWGTAEKEGEEEVEVEVG